MEHLPAVKSRLERPGEGGAVARATKGFLIWERGRAHRAICWEAPVARDREKWRM